MFIIIKYFSKVLKLEQLYYNTIYFFCKFKIVDKLLSQKVYIFIYVNYQQFLYFEYQIKS